MMTSRSSMTPQQLWQAHANHVDEVVVDETLRMFVNIRYENLRLRNSLELIKKHGRMFNNAPYDYAYPVGEHARCFENAARLASVTGLTYCEGFLLLEVEREGYLKVVPMAHAWCCKPDGTVVDPVGHKYQGSPKVRYVGIPIQTDYVLQWKQEQGFYGVMDGHPDGLPVGIKHEPIEKWLQEV